MKRLIIIGDNIVPAAKQIFADSERYTEQQMAGWPELELTVQDDGSYSVWVNLMDDAELLQDRTKDRSGMVEKIMPYVSEIVVD